MNAVYLSIPLVCFLIGYTIGQFHKGRHKVKPKSEQVNHPVHYKSTNGKECIDYMIEKYGEEWVYHFCVLNAYKYKFRAGKKDDNSKEQDLAKAMWYEKYASKLSQHFINY